MLKILIVLLAFFSTNALAQFDPWNASPCYTVSTFFKCFPTGGYQSVDGVVGAPALSFAADPDTGFYRIGANDVGISTGGVKQFEIDTNGLSTFTGSINAGNGLVGTPAFSFASDPDTGMYRIGANDLGLVAAGALGVEVVSGGIKLPGGTPSTLSTYQEGTFTITSASYSGTTITGGSGLTTSGLYYRQIGKTVFCQIVAVSFSSALNITGTGTAVFTLTGVTGLPSFTSKTAVGGSVLWSVGSHAVSVTVSADTLGSSNLVMTQDIYTGQTGALTTSSLNFWYTLP